MRLRKDFGASGSEAQEEKCGFLYSGLNVALASRLIDILVAVDVSKGSSKSSGHPATGMDTKHQGWL